MQLKDKWIEAQAVPNNADIHEVFSQVCSCPSLSFVPVVDHNLVPIGVIREYDLRYYAYARFGHGLIQREKLETFIKPSLVLPDTVSREDLLKAAVSNPNPDGMIITNCGKYRAILLNDVIMHLFEQQHVETSVRVAQAQKMEAIGTLAGGIAHDLNNILTPIMGYTQLLKQMVANGEQADPSMLGEIEVSVMRAREAVNRILAFSRQQKAETKTVAVSNLVKEVVRLLANSIPSNIEIEMSLLTENDIVLANPGELHQVLMNLCINAYHAMRERGGVLHISLTDHYGLLPGWTLFDVSRPNPMLCLTVRDTGLGIKHEILPKIFEPFFTTKQQGDGTGLGLSIVHGVISRLKGLISVETEPGQGTAFHVFLPYHQKSREMRDSRDQQNNQAAERSQRMSSAKKLRVLYVDDEIQVSRLAQRFLARLNIDVEAENDSTKAADTIKTRLDNFDLIVTDQMMPGFKGVDLAKCVKDIRPGFPIILCSGYNDLVSPEEMRDLGFRAFLGKPVDFNNMANEIWRCVEA